MVLRRPNAMIIGERAWRMRRHQNTATVIQRMARRYGVTYVPTPNDAWAGHITRLAGDSVELDPIEQTLIALQRAGRLSRPRLIELQAAYLNESKR